MMKFKTKEINSKLKVIIGRLPTEDGKYVCRAIYKDPLSDIYPIIVILYVIVLGCFLLWPFDFIHKVKNDARWIRSSKGIEFLKVGQAVFDSSTQELFNHLVKGSGLTIALWLETGDINQAGPARIMSYSVDKRLSNFMLGQARDKLIVRIRTTKTKLSGKTPHIVIIETFNHRNMQQVVITYDFSEQQVYINGEQRARSNVVKGDFSNWDSSCRLAIGNEVSGDRPWKGKIYYAAVFDRALTEQEIHENYISGLHLINQGGLKRSISEEKNLVARYLFDEEKGHVIHDSSSVLNSANLLIPKYIRHEKGSFFNYSFDSIQGKSEFSDLIINILIFIPLGIFIHGMLRTRIGVTIKISFAALLVGALFSLSVESIQHFSITRNASVVDLVMNTTGTGVGILIDRMFNLFLNYQAKRLQMLMYDQIE